MADPTFTKIRAPEHGTAITFEGGNRIVPSEPVIVAIRGDGIGSNAADGKGVTDFAMQTIDAAVEAEYGSKRKIHWMEAHAGDSALAAYGADPADAAVTMRDLDDLQRLYLPEDTLQAISHFTVALKGPLGTPSGGGIRSLNVALRQHFDLYACVRPIKHFPGAPTPNRNAPGTDLVIFRENTEDVYAGIEFAAGTPEAQRLRNILINDFGARLDPTRDYGLGIKPMSKESSERLARMAMQHAVDHGYRTVTVVHKGNIQKFTEGAFLKWANGIADREFADRMVYETPETWAAPPGRILLNDRIADNMLMQIQQQPTRYGVIVTPNLNGDYLSDACAALVGGLGLSPGANIGDREAIFEATHGTAPDILGKDLANPSSVMLSGAMLLDYLGWREAGNRIRNAIARQIWCAGKLAESAERPLPLTGELVKQYPGYKPSDGIGSTAYTAGIIARIRAG